MGLESEALRGFREMELRRRLRVFFMTSSPGIGISSTSESEDGGSGSVNGGGTTLFTLMDPAIEPLLVRCFFKRSGCSGETSPKQYLSF